MYKMHHPKADIDRLYVKRKGGGRGLLQIEATYKAEIINIAEYLNTKYTLTIKHLLFQVLKAIKLTWIQQLKWQQRLQKN